MDMYAPKDNLNFLTIAAHPGALTPQDVLSNLVLMGIMGDQERKSGEVNAEEALAQKANLSLPEEIKRENAATEYLYDPEWEQMWQRLNLNPETGRTWYGNKEIQLEPIEKEIALETMEDQFLQRFWEPMPEWDHSGPSV